MNEKVKDRRHIKGNVPAKEADLNSVASSVVTSWEQRPQITLIWTDAAQMKATTTAFGTAFAGRSDAKGSRRNVTHEMKAINAEINASTEQVKAYLSEVYSKKDALAHYESCGIAKHNNTYKLPIDNDSRLYALDQMLRGIALHGLNDRKYGKRYWTSIRERFVQAKAGATNSDKASAECVNNKTIQKAIIRKTLNALVHTIRANYPDTWREELRIWGFLKEKY